MGNLEGGSSTREFERWMKGALLTEEDQCRGPQERASFLGTLEDMLRKVLDTGISLHRGPVGEPGGDSLAGTFVRKG